MPADGQFPATRWSLIARVRGSDDSAARAAIEELCAQYHYPLYCYVRRHGLAHHDAQDALHDFFAKLLRLEAFANADADRGRLRTFLATSLQRFLINWHSARPHRQRECSIDETELEEDEERYRHEQFRDDETPARHFERKWAHELLEEVLRRLGENYTARGKASLFTLLRPVIMAGGSLRGEDPARLAANLDMNEGALRVALTRLLADFRTTLEAVVLETVPSPAEVQDEISHLLGVFRKK